MVDWDGKGIDAEPCQRMRCLCYVFSTTAAANHTLAPRPRRLVVPSVGRIVAFCSGRGWFSSKFALLPQNKLGDCIFPMQLQIYSLF